MAFRFQKRITLIPGFRLNLSKSGASVSVGRRGLWATFGRRGVRTTVGVPGTGLSYTTMSSTRSAHRIDIANLPALPTPDVPARPPSDHPPPAMTAMNEIATMATVPLEPLPSIGARRSIDWPVIAIVAVFALIIVVLVAAVVVATR